jgi:predicted nucleic acid-binding protein
LYHQEKHLNLVVDASVLLAVLTSEPERASLLGLTQNADLIAPASVHWEVGNALSAMLKRARVTSTQAEAVLNNYERIPIRFVEVSLREAIQISSERKIYAHDAYLIACALDQRCRLISLDRALLQAAKDSGAQTVEVPNS